MESTFTDLKTKTMTEQEAFNDPEMKTIILLSGYLRELGEGKDYETTTYKLVETLVKVFSIHSVSQQRELLRAYNLDLKSKYDFCENIGDIDIDNFLGSEE